MAQPVALRCAAMAAAEELEQHPAAAVRPRARDTQRVDRAIGVATGAVRRMRAKAENSTSMIRRIVSV